LCEASIRVDVTHVTIGTNAISRSGGTAPTP